VAATAKAEWRHQPRTHPASSSAWWRRGIPRQRRRPGSTQSASENDGRRARARRRLRVGVAGGAAGYCCAQLRERVSLSWSTLFNLAAFGAAIFLVCRVLNDSLEVKVLY